jgi:hypothetical protein
MKTDIIVKILCNESNNMYICGTGFFVSSNGHILTSAHNCTPNCVLSVYYNNCIFSAQLICYDNCLDVALVKTSIKNPDYLTFSTYIKEGDSCYSIGYKYEDSLAMFQKGIVTHLNYPSWEHFDAFLTSIAGYKGLSGSPIFNSEQQLIGILNWKKSNGSGCANISAISMWLNYALINNKSLQSHALEITTTPLYIQDILFNKIDKLKCNIHGELVTQSNIPKVKKGDILLAVDNTAVGITSMSSRHLCYFKNTTTVTLSLLHLNNKNKQYEYVKRIVAKIAPFNFTDSLSHIKI